MSDPVVNEAEALAESKRMALWQIDMTHARILRQLTGNATIEERDTWQAKSIAAQAHISGTATPVQSAMLQAEADLSGMTVDVLAEIIVLKAHAFYGLIGTAGGIRTSARIAIKACDDPDQIPVILNDVKANAESAVATYISSQT